MQKIGDVYPIDIIYKSTNNASDLFINKECDTNGYNMQAYTFKKGIYSSDNPTFTATAPTFLKCLHSQILTKHMMDI